MIDCSLVRSCVVGAILAGATGCLAGTASAMPEAIQAAGGAGSSEGSKASSFQQLSARAMADLEADKLDEAIPLLQKALTLNPQWVEGWWSLGTTFYDQDRYAEAAFAFQKVVAIDPQHGTAHALLGLSEFELGEEAAALKDIEAARNFGTDIDPQLRDVVFYHEGVLLQRSGRFTQAQQAFSSLCLKGTVTDNLIQAFGMAALHMRDKGVPQPQSEAGQAAQLIGHAACLAAQKDFASSTREFQAAIERFPNFPYVHYAFGRELLEAQNVNGAVEEFKREIAEGHDRVLPMLQIAAAEYKVDSSAGLPFAQDAVRLAPQLPFAHFLLGLLLMNTGQFEKAVPELEIASKGLPEEPNVFYSLGSAYEHVGRTRDAIKARAEFARLKKMPAQQSHATEGQSTDEIPMSNISGSSQEEQK